MSPKTPFVTAYELLRSSITVLNSQQTEQNEDTCACESVRERVCARESARERERESARERARESVRACACVRVVGKVKGAILETEESGTKTNSFETLASKNVTRDIESSCYGCRLAYTTKLPVVCP